ncbi:MAG: hypothetical protein DCC75_03255 [Proteobacteria bacterium]|nr:MAG: hypothetical protein DCC75_03255 [Pseudomonadota bacterium]
MISKQIAINLKRNLSQALAWSLTTVSVLIYSIVFCSGSVAWAQVCTKVFRRETTGTGVNQIGSIIVINNNYDRAYSIPKFSSPNETLCFVHIQIKPDFQFVAISQNLTNQTADITANVKLQIFFDAPAPFEDYVTTQSIINDVKAAPAFSSSVWSLGPYNYTQDFYYDIAQGADLKGFIADPERPAEQQTFDINVSGYGTSSFVSNNGNVRTSQSLLSGAKITVTYYTYQ